MLDRLQDAFARQTAFVADASHELRTPLTVIRGQLEVLALQARPAARTRCAASSGSCLTEIDRMERLTEDLLVLAHADEDALPAARRRRAARRSPPSCWRASRPTARPPLRARPACDDVHLAADPDRLAQALRNLLRNAIEHTERGRAGARWRPGRPPAPRGVRRRRRRARHPAGRPRAGLRPLPPRRRLALAPRRRRRARPGDRQARRRGPRRRRRSPATRPRAGRAWAFTVRGAGRGPVRRAGRCHGSRSTSRIARMTLREVMGAPAAGAPAVEVDRPGLRRPPGRPGHAVLLRPRLHARRPRLRAGRRRRAARSRSSCSARWASACPRCSSTTSAPRWRPPPPGCTATRPRALQVAGITGTNGKTTTAYLLRVAAGGRRAPHRAARDGLQRRGRRRGADGRAPRPEAIDLQRDVRGDARRRGHRTARWRSPPTRSSCAAPTPCTGRWRSSRTSPRTTSTSTPTWRPTSPPSGGCSSAPRARGSSTPTTPTARRLAREFPDAVTFGLRARRRAAPPTCASGPRRARRSRARRRWRCARRCPGRFNVANALGAIAAARAFGVPDAVSAAALPRAARVPGRFEPIDEGQDFAVLVDYAHTPGRPRERAAGRARADARAACWSPSAPAATATGPSAR